ncbi:FtsK/SpoIIIE domain-containing protein [Streptomyces sp. NPDC058471]|uniref:FtsK/SpoIIIE domain-containing protein n=1 Tax=Streptomyces sp. NPDC058471 TaxID=3346516 RepID=UPI003647C322
MEFKIDDGPFSAGTASALDEFPELLGYEDARNHLWNSVESEVMLGVDSLNQPVTVDLASDTPHVMVSAASGAGKSVIAASMATQVLVKGGEVVFLDVKRISHRWAKNLPGVHYAVEIHDIANALVSVAAEVKRRMRIIDDYPGDIKDAPVGPRIVIIAEELNSMMEELGEFEKTLPRRGVYKPSRAFGDIMNLGRAAKVHMIGFGQYVDAKVIPKRWQESFGYKLMLRHSVSTWNMLAWNVGYCPPAPQQPGRGFTVMGDRAVQTQFLYISEEQCADLVRSAYDARERMGLIAKPPSRRQRREQERELKELERSS